MTIVCVDNTPIMLEFLKENAAKAFPGANVMSFPATELLCEINPPRLEGLFLAEKIRKINPKVNIIFVTVCSEGEYAKEVMRLKPSGYLTKEAISAQILEELQNLRYPTS